MEGFEAMLWKAVTRFQVPLAVSKRLPYTSLQGHHNQHCRLCRKPCQNFLVFIFAEDGVKSSRNRDNVDVPASDSIIMLYCFSCSLSRKDPSSIWSICYALFQLFSFWWSYVYIQSMTQLMSLCFLSFNCRNCTKRTESGRLRCRFGRNMGAQEEQYFIK